MQSIFRIALARKELAKRRIDRNGEKRVRQMTTFIKYHSDPELLHYSARIIHKKGFMRIVKFK